MPFVPRLEQVAAKLDCGPSMPAVAEKMARSLLWAFPDESEAIEHKFCCRLCGESRPTLWDLKEHIALLHLHGGGDQDRAFVEYRKKVLALAELAGPQARACKRGSFCFVSSEGESIHGLARHEPSEGHCRQFRRAAAPRLSREQTQARALSLLRRLAFGMQRCVAKSNGEMAYQLLYQQEQLVSYSGYNMFFRFVPYAIQRCRQVAMDTARLLRPDLRAMPLETVESAEPETLPVQEVADLQEDGPEEGGARRQPRVVSFNQWDDYLHRGPSALLASMSLVTYSRHVRRQARSRAGRVDFVRCFPFDEHYAHFATSVQAGLCELFCLLAWFASARSSGTRCRSFAWQTTT